MDFNTLKKISLLMLVLFDNSCAKEQVTVDELKSYVMDSKNGLRKSATKNGITIEAIYRPTELVLAQQLDGIINLNERQEIKERISNLTYFILKLSNNNKTLETKYISDPGSLQALNSYLSSDIKDNISLITEGETIPTLDIVYTPSFEASSFTNIMIVFKGDLNTEGNFVVLRLTDDFLGIGIIEFTFNLSHIKKAPTLNLK